MMRGVRYLKGQVHAWRQRQARQSLLARCRDGSAEITRAHWRESLADPTEFYTRCFQYFHTRLPAELQAHRRYFAEGGRGFGEEAFHVMWFQLFRELRPASFLEIGVYRGQTISLAALLARQLDLNCEVNGISPFSPAGDARSKYREEVDYHTDTLANFAHFNLPVPRLLKAYSTDAVALEQIAARSWDLIYIDGNHDYEVARSDWEACARAVKPQGVIVLDDAGLGSAYVPPRFAFGGHPGPSRIVQEIDRSRFQEILQVGHNRVFQKLPQ